MSWLRRSFLYLIMVFAVLAVLITAFYKHFSKPSIEQFDVIEKLPRIYPDYSGTVIPANIAPLNFSITEEGNYYFVRLHSQKGKAVEVFSRQPKIVIPQKAWRNLLSKNRGQELYFDIFVRNGKKQWHRFQPLTNRIASEDIDRFVVYRKIHPLHSTWRQIGIYQRNLENFDERAVLTNDYFHSGCLNCHTFNNNKTDCALYSIRSAVHGTDTLLVYDNKVQKIGTKFTYSSWHPSGKLAVFSVNKVRQFFHTHREEVRDVIDLDSLLAYYVVDSQSVKTSSKFSRKDYLETYPAWSPEGDFLYFCSAPIRWSRQDIIPPAQYDKVKYDLLRIDYDIESDQWGELETVVSSKDTGLSISMPRISPDGRWLLLCMADYGCFNVYSKSSDLYIVDLADANQSGEFIPRRLEVNSDQSESWHCWSSNSRWIVFSSKRDYGVFTRLYLSYIDQQGNTYKPFVLPQKDPTLYDSCLLAYNTPELVTEPVSFRGEELARIVRSSRKISPVMPVTMATPTAEGAPVSDWQGQRE